MATSPPAATHVALERLAEAAAPGEVLKRRMLLIVNPYATTVSDRLRTLVAYALQGRFDVTAVDTERRGHATLLAREAADAGYDVVVAFGGDGTVNEAANGLAGSGVPLTHLPGGATNVFAKLLGVPGEIVDATEHLLALADDWRVRDVDLATVNGRLFTFSAGVGLDATVVKRVDERPERKTRFGAPYFALRAVSTYFRDYAVKPPCLVARVGDQELRGVTAVVQNGEHYTYFNDRPIVVAEGAGLDSGTLAGIVLQRVWPIDVPTLSARLLSGGRLRAVDHARVSGFGPCDEVEIVSDDGRPVSLQVDGDFIGDVTEARFGVVPGALRVVA